MANLNQSRKRARQMIRRRRQNVVLKSTMQTHIKRTRRLVQAKADPEELQTSYKLASSAVDKAAKKGIVHKATSARYKKRLAAAVKKSANN